MVLELNMNTWELWISDYWTISTNSFARFQGRPADKSASNVKQSIVWANASFPALVPSISQKLDWLFSSYTMQPLLNKRGSPAFQYHMAEAVENTLIHWLLDEKGKENSEYQLFSPPHYFVI